jgi:hypothetical protein
MSINPTSNAVAVESTAVLLIDDDTTPKGRSEDGRVTYTLFNLGAGIVYLGESDVDDQSGLPLVVNGALSIFALALLIFAFQEKMYMPKSLRKKN